MNKNKLIFGAVVAVAVIYIINASKNPTSIFAKIGTIGA